MQFDPKLKNAMEEIKQILKNYDIAGIVVLHNNTGPDNGHGEYMMKIDPSYSCANLNDSTGELRLKATEEMYGKAKRDRMLEDTANMFVMLTEGVAKRAMDLMAIEEMLKKKFEITTTDNGNTSHETQNN